MKNERIAALLLSLCLLAGCASAPSAPASEPEQASEAEQILEPVQPETSVANTSAVADASEMTTVEDVVEEGMMPVYASELYDGTYAVAVDCSSSMFKIADCELNVDGDKMTAKLTMSSDAYGYLYAGSAEEAAAADASAYLEPEGTTFVLPVEALDAGVSCAAWSRNKEKWYDRTLVFRADSLPLTAFQTLNTAESLGLADGLYEAVVELAGGSGKASVASPCELLVEDGTATATIVWSSANYDYMLVDGERYDAEIVDGHSTFVIPVAAFDRPLAVVADTTAMSQPHEIDYTLRFDAASLVPSDVAPVTP